MKNARVFVILLDCVVGLQHGAFISEIQCQTSRLYFENAPVFVRYIRPDVKNYSEKSCASYIHLVKKKATRYTVRDIFFYIIKWREIKFAFLLKMIKLK